MSEFDIWQKIADCYRIEDILYIIEKDVEWLVRYKLRREILEHLEEFDID